ncbi:MAG: SpoIVB peptidase S55 domain-containing protein [Christensenellaceae bacterium]
MKKRISKTIIFAVIALCLLFCSNTAYAKAEDYLYLGGIPQGFYINERGVVVEGVSDVITDIGLVSPSKNADIRTGDKLLSIDGSQINTAKDIEEFLNDFSGEKVVCEIVRDGEKIIKDLSPVKDIRSQYKLGLFVRDGINGIGTLTFVKPNGEFMALGHPVIENDALVEVAGGALYNCQIVGVNPSKRGAAGELRGFFSKDKSVGTIVQNLMQGIRGKVADDFDYGSLKKVEKGSAKIGSAKMVTCIGGNQSEEYEISIVKVDSNAKTKNFVVKVNDERLKACSGGIVQGMSGSPILQDGKIVGAVTHVFINDPLRGYGITIDNMLSA